MPSISTSPLHLIAQPKQVSLLLRTLLVMYTPPVFSHCALLFSLQFSLKFFAGRNPSPAMPSTQPAEPFSAVSTITSLAAILALTSTVSFFSASLSAGALVGAISTAIAFRFFDPITAPTPFLPKALDLLCIIDEKGIIFSPAGPIMAVSM